MSAAKLQGIGACRRAGKTADETKHHQPESGCDPLVSPEALLSSLACSLRMSERETYSSSLIDKKSTDAHERECVHRGWTFFCSSLAQWSVYVYMRIQLLGARSCLSIAIRVIFKVRWALNYYWLIR